MASSSSSPSSKQPSPSSSSPNNNSSDQERQCPPSPDAHLSDHNSVGHVNGVSQQPPSPTHHEHQLSSSLSSPDAKDGVDKGSVSAQPTRVVHKEEPNNLPDHDNPEDASMSSPSSASKSPSAKGHAPSSAKANGLEPPSVRASKPGFFSKLFRILVPCISPSQSHPIDIDIPPSPESSPTTKPDAPQVVQVKDELPPKPSLQSPPADPLPTSKLENDAEVKPEDDKPPVKLVEEEPVVLLPTPTLLPEEEAEAEAEGLTSSAVQPPGSTGQPPSPAKPRDGDESDRTSFTDDDLDDVPGIDEDDEEDRLILNGGAGIPIGPDGVPRPLLPPISPQHAGRKCLVLDLDETLVHSSFKSIQQADYVVPVEIEYHWHNVYVIKRPGVDNFLKKMGEIYEIVVFTASLSKYADPVLDKLDIHQVVSHRLFRESCYNHKGNYVKDLSQLGRPISDTIILDNSPASYIFHPNNAVPVSSWFNDPHDTELTDLVPFLADLSTVDDVRGILDGAR